MPLVTKLVRMAVYPRELPPINLHNPSMTCPFEITWQIKYILTPLEEDSWTPN